MSVDHPLPALLFFPTSIYPTLLLSHILTLRRTHTHAHTHWHTCSRMCAAAATEHSASSSRRLILSSPLPRNAQHDFAELSLFPSLLSSLLLPLVTASAAVQLLVRGRQPGRVIDPEKDSSSLGTRLIGDHHFPALVWFVLFDSFLGLTCVMGHQLPGEA